MLFASSFFLILKSNQRTQRRVQETLAMQKLTMSTHNSTLFRPLLKIREHTRTHRVAPQSSKFGLNYY